MKKATILYLILTTTLFSCYDNQEKAKEKMNTTASPKHFVFVPGAFHASWSWYKMEPLLTKNRNTSEAIDLPAHGRDTTPINQITLDSYVEAVCKVLDKYNEPVVLIGHSLAGIVISQVVERMPDKVDKLVYLSAFLIPNGESMVATAVTDSTSAMISNQIVNEAEGWFFPKESIFKEALYNDCSEEDLALCSSLLTKEPNEPIMTPMKLSDARYGKVEKVYIHTTLDNTVTHGLQKRMVKRIPVAQTYELKAGHSPFLSKPTELAEILLSL